MVGEPPPAQWAIDLFKRKPRKAAAVAPEVAPVVEHDGSVDLREEVETLLARVGVLERELAAARLAAPAVDDVRAHRRRRWARGGARVRDLRSTLRLTRLMLARQQRARGLSSPHKLSLVGGRAQLRERLAGLPSVGNPYTSLGSGS